MGNLIMRDQVAGADATIGMYSNYRLINEASLSLNMPLTTLELLQNPNASSTGIVAITTNSTSDDRRSRGLQVGVSSSDDKSKQLQAVELASKFWAVERNSTDILQSNILMVKTLNIDTVLVTINKLPDYVQLVPNMQAWNELFETPLNFTTDCGASNIANYSFICPDSGMKLVHVCNGTAGRYVSYCPVQTIGCNLLSLADKSIQRPNDTTCVTVSDTAEAITCLCKVPMKPASFSSTTSSSVISTSTWSTGIDEIDQSGVLTLAAMAYFVSTEFKNTFNAAPNALSSAADTKKVLTVILMFGILWSVGAILIIWMGILRYNKLHKPKPSKIRISNDGSVGTSLQTRRTTMMHRSIRRQIRPTASVINNSVTMSATDKDAMQLRLSEYVRSVMPSVFNTSSAIMSITKELQRHHAYFRLFWYSPTEADRLPVLIVTQLLTNLTGLMFLLALLYDLQKPSDDGSCMQFISQGDCLGRKSLLDGDQTYCQWIEEPTGSESCIYNPVEINFKIQMYCFTIVSIFTALFMNPIDYLFSIIAAPVQIESLTNVTPIDRAAAGLPQIVVPMEDNGKHGRDTIIILPEETEHAYRNARLSTMYLTNIQVQRERLNMEEAKNCETLHGTAPEQVRTPLMQQLVNELANTRNLLNQNPQYTNILTRFDESWYIDQTTGEFKKVNQHTMIHSTHTQCIEECILEELENVQTLVRQWVMEFKHKSEEQAGVQLLQLFIEDLLGRDTDAAKIFKVKVHEDYTTLPVVSRLRKGMAVCALVGLNSFFLYYALLRGYQQGVEWQQAYLMACIIQIIMEVFFSETLQCLYINYFVPRLMSRSQIDKVRHILQTCIAHLCHFKGTPSLQSTVSSWESSHTIDAPNYFFVSTQVAKAFPTMMESMMIVSYHSMFPGEIGRKWNDHENASKELKRVTYDHKFGLALRNIRTALTVLLSFSIVKFMTSAPVSLQKLTIRFCERWSLVVWFCFGHM
jgi:hypothetical protein